MSFSVGVHVLKTSLDEVSSNIFHFIKNECLEVIVFVRVGGIEISLKLTIAHLIGLLVFPILLSSLLNSIICQMNHLIL